MTYKSYKKARSTRLTVDSTSRIRSPAEGRSFQPATRATNPGLTESTSFPASFSKIRGVQIASPAISGPLLGDLRKTPRVIRQVAVLL